MNYLWAFAVGGGICVVGQLLIDYTKLTPARILTGYVVAGVILSAVGLYKPLADFAGAGASVPLLGFGHLLAQGAQQAWSSNLIWIPPDTGIKFLFLVPGAWHRPGSGRYRPLAHRRTRR